MRRDIHIFYLHGMGGGGDSRIPSILNEYFMAHTFRPLDGKEEEIHVEVIVRTYDFDPEKASRQIQGWLQECQPTLIIGESLGSIHAIRLKGYPHILVSPSLGAPAWMGNCAPLARIPGMEWLMDRIFKGKEGDRQKMYFQYPYLVKYKEHGRLALANSPKEGSQDYFYAFFGTKDHYRKSGVVSVRRYRKYFGDTYTMYEGTHFMEEEYLHSLLVPKILEYLRIVEK